MDIDMSKRFILGLVMVVLLAGFTAEHNDVYPPVPNDSFKRGEVLEFKMTYGIFTVGRGSANIHPNYYEVNDRECFKVDVFARTVGLVDWVADVNDQFGAYIDTASLLPHMFYRKIREGNYKKDEQTYFDHAKQRISVRTIDYKTGKWNNPNYYDSAPGVRDMIGGFLYLRTVDLSETQVNDTITISGFFEDEFYKLRVIYKGRDEIKTRVGRVRTLVFKPVMPKNKLFDGENSITAYFSDDKNRIPVRIDAEMFIGTAGVELTGHSGLRNPLNVVD